MLPLAVTLMVGLLLGFVAGYLVGGRDRQAQPSTSAPASTPAEAPPGSSASGQQPSGGREFSEQVVAPSGGARGTPGAQPPRAAPPVPAEGARRSESAPARPAVPVRGRLVVQSSPSRANVTVNGQWRGRTPLTLENLPLGQYNLRVVQPGFDVAREQVTLSASQAARTVSVRLQRTRSVRADDAAEPVASANGTGVLFVDSRPRGAQVFVDGRLVGTTPVRVPEVAIGSHVVRLELKGHSRWSTSTTVSSGREARVTGSLDPIQ